MMQKLMDVDDAIALIQDESTLAVGGFVGICHPEELTLALERRYLNSGKPERLTLVYAAGQGDGESPWAPRIGKTSNRRTLELSSKIRGISNRQ